MPTVSAIVLTYNRVELLKQCLDGIVRQTVRPDHIIVVNNGSTDNTCEFLSAYFQAPIIVADIAQNCGAAGGFHHALKAGRQSGADMLWLMDDDVVPAPDALARLIEADADLDRLAFDPPYLLSVARSPDGSITNVPDIDSRQWVHGYPQWPALLDRGLMPIRRGTFVSALFKRRTIDDFGLPLAEMYMWGEDSEYTMRITRQRSGFLVGDSHVEHLRAQPGSLDITTERDPRRIALHRVHVRNLIYTSRLYMGRRRKVHAILRVTKLLLRLLKRGRFAHARIVGIGLIQGLTFNPVTARDPARAAREAPPVALVPIHHSLAPSHNLAVAGKGDLECAS